MFISFSEIRKALRSNQLLAAYVQGLITLPTRRRGARAGYTLHAGHPADELIVLKSGKCPASDGGNIATNYHRIHVYAKTEWSPCTAGEGWVKNPHKLWNFRNVPNGNSYGYSSACSSRWRTKHQIEQPILSIPRRVIPPFHQKHIHQRCRRAPEIQGSKHTCTNSPSPCLAFFETRPSRASLQATILRHFSMPATSNASSRPPLALQQKLLKYTPGTLHVGISPAPASSPYSVVQRHMPTVNNGYSPTDREPSRKERAEVNTPSKTHIQHDKQCDQGRDTSKYKHRDASSQPPARSHNGNSNFFSANQAAKLSCSFSSAVSHTVKQGQGARLSSCQEQPATSTAAAARSRRRSGHPLQPPQCLFLFFMIRATLCTNGCQGVAGAQKFFQRLAEHLRK